MIRSNLKSGSAELNVIASDVTSWTADKAYDRVYISGFCANDGTGYDNNPSVKVNSVTISNDHYLYNGHYNYTNKSAGGFMAYIDNVAANDVVTFSDFNGGYGTAKVTKTVFMA